jgi:Fe-S cluster assembly protein SufD
VERALGQACANEHHGFVAFNTAFFGEGLFLCVQADCALDRPVQLLHVSTQNDTAANLRNLIVLETGAQATYIETFVAPPGTSTLTTSVTEALIAETASLDCYSLQNQADRGFLFGGLYASVGHSARLNQTNLSLGGLLLRQEIHADLGEAAQCTLNGLFLGRQRQHVDNHTLVHHRAPKATTREHYRGILSERARGIFQGRIVVHPSAQQTDAQMNNRNLLLSDDAEVDSKPQLEIHADDVKCAHGVAIGQLDPESVFYLESRGVDSTSARNMLTFAFANAMLEHIHLPSVKNLAREELLALFPQAGIRKDWL